MTLALVLISLISAGHPALDSVRLEFKNKESFKVQFEQKVTQELFPDDPEQASGRIQFTKPNQFEWVYEKPQKKKIRFDGKQLWVDGELVTTPGISLEEAFSFLWGEADSKIFDIEKVSTKQFRLKVKKGLETSFKSIDVWVENSRVSQAIVHDQLDGSSQIRFFNWKF